MAHYGLGALAATSADGLLDAIWALLSGQTDHGWTWAREGTTDAVYGSRAVTGGVLVVAVAGDAAASTPSATITPDTAGANRVWVGVGFVPTGSTFTWAGWTAANPMTEGNWLGWTSWCTPTSGAIADEVEAIVCDGGLWLRLEGTTTSASRHAWMGDTVIPYAGARLLGSAVTPQAHGACIGLWTTPEGTIAGTVWTTSSLAIAGAFGAHNAAANSGHCWIMDGTTRTAAQIELPIKRTPSTTSDVGSGGVGGAVAIVSLYAAPNDQAVGYSPHFCGSASSVAPTVTDGGIPVYHRARRDSGAVGPTLGVSVSRLTPGV